MVYDRIFQYRFQQKKQGIWRHYFNEYPSGCNILVFPFFFFSLLPSCNDKRTDGRTGGLAASSVVLTLLQSEHYPGAHSLSLTMAQAAANILRNIGPQLVGGGSAVLTLGGLGYGAYESMYTGTHQDRNPHIAFFCFISPRVCPS